MPKGNSEVCPTFFTCVWFYYFNFKRNYDILKLKSPYILLNKNIDFNKNETELKMENPARSFRETTISFSSYKNGKLKQNCDELELPKEKRGHFLYRLFYPKEIFLTFEIFLTYLSVQCIEYTFRIYILLHIRKHDIIHFCCLLLKSLKAFTVSLKTLKLQNLSKKFEFEGAWGMFR